MLICDYTGWSKTQCSQCEDEESNRGDDCYAPQYTDHCCKMLIFLLVRLMHQSEVWQFDMYVLYAWNFF